MIELGIYIIGLSLEQMQEQYQKLQNVYNDYRKNTINNMIYRENRMMNLRILIDKNSGYQKFLSTSKLPILRNSIYIEKYETYLYSIVELSQQIVEYHDILSAMEYITKKLNLTDDYIPEERKIYKQENNNLQNLKTSLILDKNEISSELLKYLQGEDAPNSLKAFYQEKLNSIISNI
jgi:hypothetical protein